MDLNDKIKIVTFATENKLYMDWLILTCERNNTELVVLGMGTKWTGYLCKYNSMLEWYKTQDPELIVCFVDAYDVIMVKSIEEFYQRYIRVESETNCKIICAKDLDTVVAEIFFETNGKVCINSGTYVGRVKNLINITNEMISYNNKDDQVCMNRYYCNHEEDVYIDYEKIFFLVPHQFSDLETYDEKCCFIHKAGSRPLFRYLRKNGYEVSKEREREITRESVKYTISRFDYSVDEYLSRIKERIEFIFT